MSKENILFFLVITFFIIVIFSYFIYSYGFVAYDYYTHIFFAKHYRNNWFSFYEPHIAGGFSVTSYPPLTHQIIALLSFIFPLETAGNLVIAISWILISYFSAKFVIEYLKLKQDMLLPVFVSVFFSIGILKTIFIFGQMTTLSFFALFFSSLYIFIKCIRENKKENYAILSLLLSLTAFSHIYSFIFLPLALLLLAMMEWTDVKKKLKQLVVVGIISSIIIIAGLFPLFENVIFNPDGIPKQEIPHESRYPLITQNALKRWVLSTYGLAFPLIFLTPIVIFLKHEKNKKMIKLYAISIIFLLIGLGNTTSLPQIVFSKFNYWLTYDRFLMFSALILLSLIPVFLRIKFSSKIFSIFVLFVVLYAGINLYLLFNTRPFFFGEEHKYRSDREDAIQYTIDFLNNRAEKGYRYQTFGFSKPVSKIYLYSELPTIDTDYFTGRSMDWINMYGIDEIDSTRDKQFLSEFFNRSSNYSIKYIITLEGVISGDNFYYNLVQSNKWKKIETKEFDIVELSIWENPENLEKIQEKQDVISFKNYFWGAIPILTLALLISIIIRAKRLKSI